ncbi:SpoIVB peptidase S55 domain-containing protein [Anaeroselena agilis]|uniref:SpoIVB peptidase S55 domain-containing protein n=1 Tax=Anaeroselena agilis TaxID=3063788 RepID=A0ABU3P547_9FIRM|nr:SpoIVB peptidase S55 domain-containing protein [Selenomonadales bacterium 4137-cl]
MAFVFRLCRVALLAMLLTLPAAVAAAAPETMPLEEVRAGMQGIARTVVSGTDIEEFGIEVLGIMKNKGPSGDLILVRTYGDLIDRTGGIAQGMSGSPVYIGGRLVGAIAYGWSFTDHKIGMVTPIADMLKLWELPAPKPRVPEVEQIKLVEPEPESGDKPEEKQPDDRKPPAKDGVDKSGQDLKDKVTPLMAAGFGERALAFLTDKLRPLNLTPYAVGESPEGTEYAPLEPGSAVGVQLVRGDVSLGAMGTVTYTDGNKILAFGHPFLKKGNTGYFLTNAYVFTTVKGLENSFKVGAIGPAVGIVDQDRGAGIAGQLGVYPSVVPLRVNVTDRALGTSRDAIIQVVQDEQLFPILTAASVLSILEKTADRVGAGTAKITFEISARNMPGDVFKRENMFYSPANIGEMAISELYELMALLAANQFQAVDVIDVQVDATVDPERRTATIMEARSNVASAKPGEKIEIAVSLKPYRGEMITVKVPFTIPRNQQPGPLTLEVRGGGMVPLIELLAKRQQGEEELLQTFGKLKTKTFDDMIKELAERDRNNDIVVEVLSGEAGELLGGMGASKAPSTKLDPIPRPNAEAGQNQKALRLGKGAEGFKKPTPKSTLSTEYIIDSDTQVLVNVEKSDIPPGKAVLYEWKVTQKDEQEQTL